MQKSSQFDKSLEEELLEILWFIPGSEVHVFALQHALLQFSNWGLCSNTLLEYEYVYDAAHLIGYFEV